MPDESKNDMTPEFLKKGGQGAREEREKRAAERGAMSAEEATKRVADADKARTSEVPPPEPTQAKFPEVPGLVRDAVIAGVSAVGGGLMTEVLEHAFEAIDDRSHRSRVSREVHSHDKDYKGDEYRDLDYGELKNRMSTTQDPKDLAEMRKSEKIRFNEAASYGVMTGAEGTLTDKLIEADKDNYPALIARAADKLEQQAQEKFRYIYNPRIQGVVASAGNEVVSLVAADFAGKLDDKARDSVLWAPKLEFATFVNSETVQQKQERIAEKQANDQREHELRMEEAKARSKDAADAQSGVGDDSSELLRKVLEQMSDRQVRIVEDEIIDWTQYDQDFLRAHGLPSHIYIPVGIELHRRDMRTALALASNIGEFTGLSPENFIRALIEDEKDSVRKVNGVRGGKELELPRDVLEMITIQGQKEYKNLSEGIVPLMIVKKKDGGTFPSIAGNPKAPDSKLQAGALIAAGFDLKDTFKAFSGDIKAKKALSAWMALYGEEDKDIDAATKTFVDSHKKMIRDMMTKDHKELTRDAAVASMDQIAELMEKTLKIDKGRVALMRELANLLVPGPEMQGYRKLLKTHPVLRQFPEEIAARPILEKIFYAGKPGFLSDGLKEFGIDELFNRVARLDSGNLQIAYRGMRDLQDGMDDIDLIRVDGKDSFTGSEANVLREMKIAELAAALGEGDNPKIKPQTIKLIERLPMYRGNGKLSGREGFFSWRSHWASIRRLVGF